MSDICKSSENPKFKTIDWFDCLLTSILLNLLFSSQIFPPHWNRWLKSDICIVWTGKILQQFTCLVIVMPRNHQLEHQSVFCSCSDFISLDFWPNHLFIFLYMFTQNFKINSLYILKIYTVYYFHVQHKHMKIGIIKKNWIVCFFPLNLWFNLIP